MTPPIELDNRGLEPPEPMTRILEALERLPEGGTLVAHNDRRPMFLYPLLQERDFVCDTEDLPDGSARLTIRRKPG